MKKFTINCDFNGQMAPFTICLGKPEPGHHPLFFQADWLQKSKGGTIPPQVMDAVAKLKTLSEENNVSFEELCVYALGAAQQKQDSEAAAAATAAATAQGGTAATDGNKDTSGGAAPAG